ncbi:FAD-binding domain-containing protein [Pluteus cervinus]|uniref:FAD-binding domain-containing protein n=1 Tax=Pluteus cervinus TaxID=181527 RepID=A0ACD3B538_9AGAR|nr:FAD-binding domain-containing protein [Pluteus cervinus]
MVSIASFSGDLVTPTDSNYSQAISRWAKNAERKAAVVAFVKNEQDVALALKYAKANGLPVAVRGGGHSAAGASSIEGGLVVDLSRHLSGTRVDPESRLAYIGGGATWESVDKAAIEHDLATVGGTVNHTGVGGLILGGGYGFLTGAHGMVIDNLVEATIVTANGSVLKASETENPDLFFGIRGGGGNFGVVTEFVLKLYPQRRTVYAGMLIYKASDLKRIIDVTTTWYPNAGEKETVFHFTTVGPDGNPIVALLVFYNGSEAEGRENFKAFLEIGPLADTAKEIPYEALNTLQNKLVLPGASIYMTGIAQATPDYDSILAAHAKVIDICKNPGFGGAVLYEYFPLSKVVAVPNGTMAFRRFPTSNILVLVNWDNHEEGKSEIARAGAHALIDILRGGLTHLPREQTRGYTNYDFDGAEKPDRARDAFGDVYPKLQEIKKKYDPENVFNKWFPITPAA